METINAQIRKKKDIPYLHQGQQPRRSGGSRLCPRQSFYLSFHAYFRGRQYHSLALHHASAIDVGMIQH